MKYNTEWKDYEVLSTSNGEKLERWGNITLVRPDPQVIWNDYSLLDKKYQFIFDANAKTLTFVENNNSNEINEIKTKDDLPKYLGKMHRFSSAFWGDGVGLDEMDSDHYLYNIGQGGIGLSRDYYFDDDAKSKSVRKKYKQYIKDIMNNFGILPEQKFGQNFLCDEKIIDSIIEVSGICEGSTVLEIGPGIGALTSRIQEITQDYTCVEIDKRLASFLRENVIKENVKIIDSDLVVICVGVKPNIEIAKDAGVAIGETGAIKVNSRMQTNLKDIYACGDCAEKFNIISNTPMWFPLGSTANKEGRIAASNITGQVEDFEGILGSVVTRFKDLSISMSGLSERHAKELHYDTVSVMITKKDKAGYMPEVENITLKIVADKRSHRILGAQAIGCIDADKKINEMIDEKNVSCRGEDYIINRFTVAPKITEEEVS